MNKHYPITLSWSTNNIINNIVKSLSAVPQGRHSCHSQMNEDQKQRGYYWQPFLDHIENVIFFFTANSDIFQTSRRSIIPGMPAHVSHV